MPIIKEDALIEAIIEEIGQGLYDGHLKRIAKACFDRAQAMGVVEQPPSKDKKKALRVKPGKSEPAFKQDAGQRQYNATRAQIGRGTLHYFNGQPVAPGDILSVTNQLLPVTNPSYAGPVIEVGGQKYPKEFLVGRYMYLPPGTYKSAQYDNAFVKITGAGGTSLKVDFETNKGGNATAFDDSAFIRHTKVGFIYG